jgi:hypothetical protein
MSSTILHTSAVKETMGHFEMCQIRTPDGPACEQAAASSPSNHSTLGAVQEDVEMHQARVSINSVREYLKFAMPLLTIFFAQQTPTPPLSDNSASAVKALTTHIPVQRHVEMHQTDMPNNIVREYLKHKMHSLIIIFRSADTLTLTIG